MDEDVQSFLKEQAIDFEKRHLSRTYLIVNEDAASEEDPAILAFFSIAINYLDVDPDVPRKWRDKLNVHMKHPIIPCYLIGQLARNDTHKGEIEGAEILEIALSHIRQANKLVGGCCVRIDCKDEAKLRKFYEKNEFTFLQMNKDGDLCQLIRLIP